MHDTWWLMLLLLLWCYASNHSFPFASIRSSRKPSAPSTMLCVWSATWSGTTASCTAAELLRLRAPWPSTRRQIRYRLAYRVHLQHSAAVLVYSKVFELARFTPRPLTCVRPTLCPSVPVFGAVCHEGLRRRPRGYPHGPRGEQWVQPHPDHDRGQGPTGRAEQPLPGHRLLAPQHQR